MVASLSSTTAEPFSVKVGVASRPEKAGASFTALTVMEMVSVSALNGLVPPPDEASAVPPAVPLSLSQARKVMVAVPL